MHPAISERIRCKSLANRMMSAEDACRFIKDGDIVVASGFTPAGYPKAVPLALAERLERTGDALSITLITGASVGDELDGALTRAGAISKRIPYQTNSSCRSAINEGKTLFVDDHLSQVAGRCRRGVYGHPDLAIVEAVMITEDGKVVPSTSVGNTPAFLNEANKVIIEVNTSQPLGLYGMHDIYVPKSPPYCDVIPIRKPEDRIGSLAMDCDPEKVVAVVVTDIKDGPRALAPGDESTARIASEVVDFLDHEVQAGRLPRNLLPLQSGVGSIANSVMKGLLESGFSDMAFFSEVIQDSVLDLLDAGKIRIASGTSLSLSPDRLDAFYGSLDRYRDKVILRPQEISNNPEVIRRLGIIAMNTAIEMDIYGNVNSTHIYGAHMMNGIGGSGDFSRNAYLTMFMAPSTAKNGTISTVVPMVSHVDHTGHEVQVLITEQGIADLRGLAPRQRAKLIIENCAHPDFRPSLRDYFQRAESKGGHTPQLLDEVFAWQASARPR